MELGKGAAPISRRDELDEMLDFMRAAHKATTDSNDADFKCPTCGSIAHAKKSAANGHVRANCNGCGTAVIE